MKIFFPLLLMLVWTPAHPAALINEVAPEESPPFSDWIEFYIAGDASNLAGCKVYEQSTLIKTFPSLNMAFSSGTYLLLHFNSSLPDETSLTGDANGNGALDLYTSDPGLTGTSNVLALKNASGAYLDVVVYSDSASWTGPQQTAFNSVVSSGHWVGTLQGGLQNFSESVNVPGGVGEGNSIARDQNSEDTNRTQDWHYLKGNQTKGFQNPAILPCPDARHIEGTITEVAPSLPLSAGGDFVEIYFGQAENLCGTKVYEGGALIKTLPSVTPGRGPFSSYVLLHASVKTSNLYPDETDSTGDSNGNGVIDLYSDESSPALTGSSDNTITLESPDGLISDFMGYSDNLPYYPASLQLAYDRAAAQGIWQPECGREESCYSAGSIPWSNSTTKSMSKKMDGVPKTFRPSSAEDWEWASPSPGKGNGLSLTSSGAGALRVLYSPFSPLGDGLHKEAMIAYHADAGSRVTVKIFNASGDLIRSILEDAPASGETETLWDGRDSQGDIAPVGIYVVWLECRGPAGTIHQEFQTVTLGRKL